MGRHRGRRELQPGQGGACGNSASRAGGDALHACRECDGKGGMDAIKIMRVGDARVREAKTQTLLKEFDAVRMRSGETLDELAMCMNGIANKLRTLGENLDEVKVVKKLLRIVPSKYTQVAIAIEQLLDLKTMSMEELV